MNLKGNAFLVFIATSFLVFIIIEFLQLNLRIIQYVFYAK